jgi:hypothetical protein
MMDEQRLSKLRAIAEKARGQKQLPREWGRTVSPLMVLELTAEVRRLRERIIVITASAKEVAEINAPDIEASMADKVQIAELRAQLAEAKARVAELEQAVDAKRVTPSRGVGELLELRAQLATAVECLDTIEAMATVETEKVCTIATAALAKIRGGA